MQLGPQAAVIADDLTGAADTGVRLTPMGSPVYLLPVESLAHERSWMSAATCFCVNTGTRQSSVQAAAKRLTLAARALSGLRPKWIYKKIDSCLRGNPGGETEVLLDVLGFDAALIAPALPAQGRTTIGGVHLVCGKPLAETEFAKDPLAPITSSVVTDIFARQSNCIVGRIDLKELDAPERLQRALQRERANGCRMIVCDASRQEHLDQIAMLVVEGSGHLLPVGSAGLAAALMRRLSSNETSVLPPLPSMKRLLLVCGTGSQVTRRQLDTLLERHPGVRRELEPEWLTRASADDLRCCAGELIGAWSEGVMALSIRPLGPDHRAVMPAQIAAGLARLAELAVDVIRIRGVDGLFLSGGETADALFRASGAETIALEREVLPGLVLGRWLGGVADCLPAVTKAGAFGQETTLVELYERLSTGAGS